MIAKPAKAECFQRTHIQAGLYTRVSKAALPRSIVSWRLLLIGSALVKVVALFLVLSNHPFVNVITTTSQLYALENVHHQLIRRLECFGESNVCSPLFSFSSEFDLFIPFACALHSKSKSSRNEPSGQSHENSRLLVCFRRLLFFLSPTNLFVQTTLTRSSEWPSAMTCARMHLRICSTSIFLFFPAPFLTKVLY